MHSFATCSCQSVGCNSQPTGLVERNTKIIVLRLLCNLTATIQQPETTRHASARPPEHNDASLVRSQVDFHIKNSEIDRKVETTALSWDGPVYDISSAFKAAAAAYI
jgi:hypothetical protein